MKKIAQLNKSWIRICLFKIKITVQTATVGMDLDNVNG